VPTSRHGYRNNLYRDILTFITGRLSDAGAGGARRAPACEKGKRAMSSSAKEFREIAQECLRWAGETESERHRQVLPEMARTCTQAALEAGRGLGLIYEGPPPQLKT
jgi:hypothetical protein